MDRVIRDGKVAVIYSPGYGAGWYTWNYERCGKEIIFDPELVALIEKGDFYELEKFAEEKYPEAYTGGLHGAAIKWLPVGTMFTIREYDGYESIETLDDIDWITC